MFRLIGNPQSNSMPTTKRILIDNSELIYVNSFAKVVDGGKLQAIDTAGDTGLVFITNIVEVDGVGAKTPKSDGTGGLFRDTQKYTTGVSNTTIYAEYVTDPFAEFEGDWDTTPTANSLETGAMTDVVATSGLTMVNANSVARGSAANLCILSTDATKLKSIVRLNLKESMFFA